MSPIPQSPYLRNGYEWLRGNLHAHTTNSDGELSPSALASAYAEAGYDFLAITDHDFCTPVNPNAPLLLIPGCEVTANGPHMVTLNVTSPPAPTADRQQVLNTVSDSGGLAVVNHPNWQAHFNHCPQHLLVDWTGYTGIEIYNAKGERQDGSPLATDRWDQLLASGRRVWGFANDDMHRPSDLGKAWVVVQALEKSVGGILEAIRAGRFYASSGVRIERITLENNRFTVETRNAQVIRFVTAVGKEVGRVAGPYGSFLLTGNERTYFRAECFGEGSSMAWTQPIWL